MNQPDPTTDRRDRYAAAMAKRDGDTWPTEYENDEADYRRRADAVMAVADAEQTELRAEVARQTELREHWQQEVAHADARLRELERRLAGKTPPAAVPSAPTSRAAVPPTVVADLQRTLAEAEEAEPEDVLADAVALLREAATLYDAREQPDSAALLRRLAAAHDPSRLAAVPAAEEQPENETPAACDHESQVISHQGALFWACMKCGTNLGRADGEQQATPPAVVPQPEEADRVVAHVLTVHTALHCLVCAPPPWGDIWTPVTAGELEDGGICSKCGVDVLIPLPAKEQP